MSSPRDFTVIIPTKDRPAMFRRALDAALAQRDADFEILVADDGDGSGAAAALAVGARRVDSFVTGRCGQVPARNQAIARAGGRWLAWLDDDDWWETPDHLARLAAALAPGPGLAYASGCVVRESADGSREPPIPFASAYDAKMIRLDNKLLVSGLAYDRGFHAAHGLFDDALPYYWDWDWYLRLTRAGVRFADAGGGGVCISARLDNVSATANDGARAEELARLCAKHGLSGVKLKNHERLALEQRQVLRG